MADVTECRKMAFMAQYMEQLSQVQQSEVLVVPMRAHNWVLGLHWFQFRNPDVDWWCRILSALRNREGVEVVTVDRVDYQECGGNIPGFMACNKVCSEWGGSTPDIQIRRATTFEDLLASQQVVGTFFLRVGDCTEPLRVNMEGITDGEWYRNLPLDRTAGSNCGCCGRSESTWELWITATGMPKHKGSTGWWGFALLWANRFKSGLLDIPTFLSISVKNW